MCRFLIVKSEIPAKPKKFLNEFALRCQKSKTLDGDWQGDGWGIAWQNPKSKWQIKKSLFPIWEDKSVFEKFPQTKLFVVHARSASFPNQKGKIEYNQPYIFKDSCFVFNGTLSGVRTKKKIKGEIGAQKIWSLLQEELESKKPEKALKKLYEFLKKNTRQIYGCNIGLVVKDKVYALCGQNCNREYFALRVTNHPSQKIICSERISSGQSRKMKTEEIVSL